MLRYAMMALSDHHGVGCRRVLDAREQIPTQLRQHGHELRFEITLRAELLDQKAPAFIIELGLQKYRSASSPRVGSHGVPLRPPRVPGLDPGAPDVEYLVLLLPAFISLCRRVRVLLTLGDGDSDMAKLLQIPGTSKGLAMAARWRSTSSRTSPNRFMGTYFFRWRPPSRQCR